MNRDALPIALRRHALVAQVRAALPESGVLVAISGGSDSTALLLLSCAVAAQRSATHFTVAAAHVNHGLRIESDSEQAHVESLCETLDIPCRSVKLSLGSRSAAAARDARYEALRATAADLGLAAIATAHHARDQLETMLMALCRGGGPRRLAGMPATRPIGDGIALHRPLLDVDPEALQEVCQRAKATWCSDPTNEDQRTPRGRLRATVLPILEELWPRSAAHAAHAATTLHAAADALEAITEDAPGSNSSWPRADLKHLPVPLVAAVLHRAVGPEASFAALSAVAEAVVDDQRHPRHFDLPGGQVAVTARDVAFSQQ